MVGRRPGAPGRAACPTLRLGALLELLLQLELDLTDVNIAVQDLPFLIDENHRGKRPDAELGGEPTFLASLLEQLWPGVPVRLEVFGRVGYVVVEVDADNLQWFTCGRKLGLNALEVNHVGLAGLAPGGPVVNEHHLAALGG